jgi:hypothetical protein
MRVAAVVALLAALVAVVPSSRAQPNRGSSLVGAVALVKKQGYRPKVSTWEPSFKLNMLIGTATGSADGYNRRAFFFYGNRYLGTDASAPSAQLQEVWREDRTIALLYILYRSNEPLCCPTAGGAIVRFRWNGSRLVALDPIPPTRGSRHR